MKTFRHTLVIVFIAGLTSRAAMAGGFGESFSNWLLGTKAEASMLRHGQPVLDDVAEGCMQCHNGIRASHVVVKHADAALQFTSSGQQINHPVGMDYDDYAIRRPRDYVPRQGLDPAIILVNGQVSCVSCHRLRESVRTQGVQIGRAHPDDCTASNELTAGPGETGLCLGCHNM